MIRYIAFFLGIIHPFVSIAAELAQQDAFLHKIIDAFQIEPYEPKAVELGPKERLGQALFFDPIVSGPQQIACAACHVRSKGSADGLPLAVGLGAKGVSEERLKFGNAFVVPRNALPFFNRGTEEFRAFFWDGRVQKGGSGKIESPLGSLSPEGFDNLLAVAATFPPAEPDEMLGRSEWRGATPATYHYELAEGNIDPDNFQERTLKVYENLIKRIVGKDGVQPSDTQKLYRDFFQKAYPGVPLDALNIIHVGNALSAYITAAFTLESAPWDLYVKGDNSALTTTQKRGALVFFGKGRCYVCHTGKQFSDFDFHGLAIPQLTIGKHGSHLDYGRAAATSRAEDRFLFRTPPLRNVEKTGPWGHNGVFVTLGQAIEHHVNPVPLLYAAQQNAPEEARGSGRLLGQRSPILSEISLLTDEDINAILAFLSALTSETVMTTELALPASVPSGNNQFIRQ
jgi:cytochrome c peroxidase